MKTRYFILPLLIMILLLFPILVSAQKLVYENPVVNVFSLEDTGNQLQEKATSTLDFIVKELIGKGSSELLTKLTTKVVSSFASLFVNLINEARNVGSTGEASIYFLTNDGITNRVERGEYFLPLFAIKPGTHLTPLHLRIETSQGSDSTNLIPVDDMAKIGGMNLVVPKRPYYFNQAGKYKFVCEISDTRASEYLYVND